MEPSYWSKDSWKSFPALQQVDWPDKEHHAQILRQIAALPPLVFAGEIRKLRAILADAAEGNAFLLQGGDCAEEFVECTAPTIRETMKVILQMAVVLSFAGEKPVIKMGRIAGQYAKPRSSLTESKDGVVLPSFRGDMVNSSSFSPDSRRPDCKRLLDGYFHSASSLNILRAFTRGGYASLEKVHSWNKEFVRQSKEGKSYEELAHQIEKSLAFMRVIGFEQQLTPQISEVDFYTSHEALLLGYEEALTRQDSLTGIWYDCSAHLLWIGDRTRQVDGAHVEFLRGIHNPIGIKIGPEHDVDEIKRLLDILNPENEAGRIVLITRFGKEKIGNFLPSLARSIKSHGARVLWSCDPMHGNTYVSDSNYKTRSFSDILQEIRSFFQIHGAEGTVPGGVHFELTGKDVTECTGGAQQIMDFQLENNYSTSCDPRLNAQQSLELAFLISDLLKG
jgi:3-deoxy-7-phosphoheptulonate synthase